jgi:hypothetical protein
MLLNAHCAHLTHRLNLVEVAKEVFDVTSVFNDMDASMIYSIKQAGVELKLQKWQSINMIASFILIVRMYVVGQVGKLISLRNLLCGVIVGSSEKMASTYSSIQHSKIKQVRVCS